MHDRHVQERDCPMKRDELLEETWAEAPLAKRVIGRKKFESLFDGAVATAPMYQICYGAPENVTAEQFRIMRERWAGRVAERRECQFGPLTWLIVGAIVNFIIWKILEWATKSRANAVMLAGWSAELSWKTR